MTHLEGMDHYDLYVSAWQEMKDLEDDMDRSIFSSGSFHVEGDSPFYFVYTGFSTDPEAFRAYELYLERYSEGSSCDEKDEAIRYFLRNSLFGGKDFVPNNDVFFKRITIEKGRENTLRLDYRLVSIRQWETFEEAERVLYGYRLWLPQQKR